MPSLTIFLKFPVMPLCARNSLTVTTRQIWDALTTPRSINAQYCVVVLWNAAAGIAQHLVSVVMERQLRRMAQTGSRGFTPVIPARNPYTANTHATSHARLITNVQLFARLHADKSASMLGVSKPALRCALLAKSHVHGELVLIDTTGLLTLCVFRQCPHQTCQLPCGSVWLNDTCLNTVSKPRSRFVPGFHAIFDATSYYAVVTDVPLVSLSIKLVKQSLMLISSMRRRLLYSSLPRMRFRRTERHGSGSHSPEVSSRC